MKTTTAALTVITMIALGVATPVHAQGKNPPGVNPTHYQCYRVSETEPFKPRDVKLRDQFGTSVANVLKTSILCAPVDKNSLPAKDKQTHYVCYEEEGKTVGRKVSVTNQFGKQILTVGGPTLLCLPSAKKLQ